MLRFGIIGAGNIASTHAAALRHSQRGELAAVAGGGSARRFAESEGVRYFESPELLVANDEVDAVILCTPSGVRLDYTVAAAERGKHVLVEKPIEVSYLRALAMIESCESHGVQLGVVFQSRFKPHCRELRRTVRRGGLGEPVLGGAYVKWYRPPEYYRSAPWRGTLRLDGGGALINQAIHTVDLLLWFLDDVRSVRARTANLLHREIEVEDTASVQLEFANGALGVIEATTAAYPGSARRIELHGTRGTAVLVDDVVSEWLLEDGTPAPAADGESGAGSGAEASHVMADHRWHLEQLDDFVAAVEEGRRPLVDGREGLRSLELVLAAYRSARLDRVVEPGELRDAAPMSPGGQPSDRGPR